MVDLRSPEEVRTFVYEETLRRRPRTPAGALLALAVMTDATPQFLAGTLVIEDQEVSPRTPRVYPTITLLERWLPFESLDSWLLAALNGTLAADPLRIATRFANAHAEPGALIEKSFPGWSDLVVRCTLETSFTYKNAPVVRAGLKPFRNIQAAARDWVYGARDVQLGDFIPNEGQLLIVIPETRGRIVEALWEKGQALVRLSGDPGPCKVELQAAFSGSAITTHLSQEVERGRCHVDVPGDADAVELYLVIGSELLSSIRLTRAQPAFGPKKKRVESVSQIERDLAGGENEHVEFKPFVGGKDDKANEIVEAVAAFANTDGGVVYVGVTNHGELEGRSSLHKRFKKSREPAEDQVAFLRTIISDMVKGQPPYTLESHIIRGDPVIVIRVNRGSTLCQTQDNQTYIRKGATCRRVDLSTERHILPGM
jgi:hypothetical protein